MHWSLIIANRNDLANLLEVSRSTLTYVLYKTGVDSYYHSFDIPKKDGSLRHIHAPYGTLKHIQSQLATALWEYQQEIWDCKAIRPCLSHAFEKEKSIITNAEIHRNKRFVLNLDLSDFFDSFHFGRVAGYFEKNRYFELPREVSIVIAQLTCYQGALPQGAPSSPIITNLIAQTLDQHLLKLARAYHLDYTRYADDLTFSTNERKFFHQQDEFLAAARQEIERCGFRINDRKTRLQYRDSRQEVTGLVVNQKLSIRREYWRDTRAMAHSLYTTGTFQINGQPGSISQLEGRFAFIDQLDRYENKKIAKPPKSGKLIGREKQYQTFLIYKYFFAHEFPLIVTEGKTDIVYLKAALKNLHMDYPNLIERNPAGGFIFKIRFLKRSKRLEYFLRFGQHGADAMKAIYDCLTNYPVRDGKNGYPLPKSPTILVFDHELESKKPLKVFADHIKLSDVEKKELGNNCYVTIPKTKSLFLVTNPLADGQAESEIEDLFDKAILAHTIDGKAFDRKVGESATTYGKDTFSKYIGQNYTSIDFTRFKPMLDAIDMSIQLYEGHLADAATQVVATTQ